MMTYQMVLTARMWQYRRKHCATPARLFAEEVRKILSETFREKDIEKMMKIILED